MLIDSFNNTDNSDSVLFIVGDGTQEYVGQLKKQVHSYLLDGKIMFFGALYGVDKNTVYDVADIFVLPSYWEGFGLTVLEAYRQKLPVITTNATIFDEIQNLGIGWYVNTSISELSGAMDNASRLDRESLKKMGSTGYDWIRSKYDSSIVMAQYEELYDWLLNEDELPSFVYKDIRE